MTGVGRTEVKEMRRKDSFAAAKAAVKVVNDWRSTWGLLAGKTVLAPLTTVGNLPFRRLCVQLGCDVTVSEMAMADQLVNGNRGELALVRRHPSETCFGVQIAGAHPETMAKCAEFLDGLDCDFVDINMGCPLQQLHAKGMGTSLMEHTGKLE